MGCHCYTKPILPGVRTPCPWHRWESTAALLQPAGEIAAMGSREIQPASATGKAGKKYGGKGKGRKSEG